jgi:hypothetical protein
MKDKSAIEPSLDDILPEYHFDYSKAKPNRFARQSPQITVTLDPDVAEVFTTSEAVNKALRALLNALPNSQFHGKV